MTELVQLVIGETGHHSVARAAQLVLDVGELLFAGRCQLYAGGASVLGVREALQEPILFEMVDKARDVARTDIERLGEIAERQGARSPQAPKDAHPAFAKVVVLEPAVHHVPD